MIGSFKKQNDLAIGARSPPKPSVPELPIPRESPPVPHSQPPARKQNFIQRTALFLRNSGNTPITKASSEDELYQTKGSSLTFTQYEFVLQI